MNNNFNLFSLNSRVDVHPRTWICIGGKELPTFVRKLEKEVIEKQGLTRENLSRELARSLNCSHTSFKQLFQEKRAFYPLPFILKLSKLAQNKKILKKINSETTFLKVNSASAKPLKVCKKLNINLAKLIGSFMADGSLSIQIIFSAREKRKLKPIVETLLKNSQRFSLNYSKKRNEHYLNITKNKNNINLIDSLQTKRLTNIQSHYAIELSDAYKDNVLFFKNLVINEFGVNPNKFYKKENMWRVTFSNKIVARFLEKFFEIWPGKKSDDAFEPAIIKKAHLKMRKAFALGLLTFDGCITKQGKMCYSSNSKTLIEALADIWKRDGIEYGRSKTKRGDYTINAYLTNDKKKLLQYFEPNTQKWKLIHWLEGDLTKKPVIKETTVTKISEEKIFNLLRRKKNCDIIYLTKFFGCKQSTARYYLKTLKKQKRIVLSRNIKSINPKNVSEKTMVLVNKKWHKKLFNGIKKRFVYDKEFATSLDIPKATLSAWKLRKNHIPLHRLETMCKTLNLDFQKFCNNLVEEDREIAAIN